jgi:selenophosphate synthase
VLDLARAGIVAGGTRRNHAWLNPTTGWGELTEPEQLVLADAQTSGGLLIATDDPASLADALRGRDVPFAEVGALIDGEPGRVEVSGRVGA